MLKYSIIRSKQINLIQKSQIKLAYLKAFNFLRILLLLILGLFYYLRIQLNSRLILLFENTTNYFRRIYRIQKFTFITSNKLIHLTSIALAVYMRGIHTQIDTLTTHLTKNISEDGLKSVDCFNMIFQKMIFQSLKLVTIVFDQMLIDENVKLSFEKFVKELKIFSKKRPNQSESQDDIFDKQYDEVSCFLNNRKPLMSNDQAQRGDIYKYLCQAQSKQKDMKQFLQNAAKFKSQKKINRLLQSSKKSRDVQRIQKQIQTELQFQEMSKLTSEIQRVQRQKIKSRMEKIRDYSKQQNSNNQNQLNLIKQNNQNIPEKQSKDKQNLQGLQKIQDQNRIIQHNIKSTDIIVSQSLQDEKKLNQLQGSPRNQKSILKSTQGSNKKGPKKSISKGRNSIINISQAKKVAVSNFIDKSGVIKQNEREASQKKKQHDENDNIITKNSNIGVNSNTLAKHNNGTHNSKKQRKMVTQGNQTQSSFDLRQGFLKGISDQHKQKINLAKNMQESSARYVDKSDLFGKKSNMQQIQNKQLNNSNRQNNDTDMQKSSRNSLFKDIQIQTQFAFYTEQQAQKIWQQKYNKDYLKVQTTQSQLLNKQNLQTSSDQQKLQNQNNYAQQIQGKIKKKVLKDIVLKQNDKILNSNINNCKNGKGSIDHDQQKKRRIEPAFKNKSLYNNDKVGNQKVRAANFNCSQNSSSINNQNQGSLANKSSLPKISHMKKTSNYSSFHAQNDYSAIDGHNSLQKNQISMPKLYNKNSEGNKNVHQDNKILRQLQRFVQQKSIKKNEKMVLMYIQFFQTMHIRQCGQKCIHLNRFYEFLKKKNIPTRKELMLHKADVNNAIQF